MPEFGSHQEQIWGKDSSVCSLFRRPKEEDGRVGDAEKYKRFTVESVSQNYPTPEGQPRSAVRTFWSTMDRDLRGSFKEWAERQRLTMPCPQFPSRPSL